MQTQEPLTDIASRAGIVEREPVIIHRTSAWAIEHEPESDTYLLVDAAGCYCAELHWSDDGECWAQFEPYVAFAGPTTVADVLALQEIATLMLSVARPAGRASKNRPVSGGPPTLIR